jgi:hypothetical protein
LKREPLFALFEPIASQLRGDEWPTLEMYAEVGERRRLAHVPDLPKLSFAAAPKKPRRFKRERVILDELYDSRIALRGEVPCLMHSYHDLLNAIVFAAFPRGKRLLHQRQYAAITRWVPPDAMQLPGRRTREQDALTIFDEGGVVLLMTNAHYSSWLSQTEPLSIEPANPNSGVLPVLFGHALLEHLHDGHQALRATGIVLPVPEILSGEELLVQVDSQLSERLAAPASFQRPDADSVFERGADGAITIRAPKQESRASGDA